jgi:hypothetical protein
MTTPATSAAQSDRRMRDRFGGGDEVAEAHPLVGCGPFPPASKSLFLGWARSCSAAIWTLSFEFDLVRLVLSSVSLQDRCGGLLRCINKPGGAFLVCARNKDSLLAVLTEGWGKREVHHATEVDRRSSICRRISIIVDRW